MKILRGQNINTSTSCLQHHVNSTLVYRYRQPHIVIGPVTKIYLELLHNKFVPHLENYGVGLQTTSFQQGGVRLHTANVVLSYLNNHFVEWVIWNQYPGHFRYEWGWSPYSPDLNPFNYPP